MAGVVDIINRALDYLGAQPLTSLDQSGPHAERARRMWPPCRDAVLREHNWKSAMRRVKLNELREKPAFGFTRRYQLPPDFLRLTGTHPENARVEVEGDTLLADAPELAIAYVARIEDPGLYDASLLDALALKLAADMAFGSTASSSLAEQLTVRYQQALRDARSYDAREGAGPATGLGSWARAKFGK